MISNLILFTNCFLVQLTVYGALTVNGQPVLKPVEEEKEHEQGMRLRQRQTEDKNVWEIQQKWKTVIKRNVR